MSSPKQLILRIIIKIVATMSDFKAKMHQNPISACSLPKIPLGIYSVPPNSLAGLKVPTAKGRDRRGRKEKDEIEGREGRGGEGSVVESKKSLK